MRISHIWTLAALTSVRFFDFQDFCSARTAPAGLQAPSRHTSLGLELYFYTIRPGVPETTPDSFKIGQRTSRSIQKVYMLISRDRTPTCPHLDWWKLIKNHENRNVFDNFRNLCALAPPATPRNDQQRAKHSFFSGLFNSPSNYAFPEMNPLRLVKANVSNFQNMQRKNVTTCKVTAWASP